MVVTKFNIKCVAVLEAKTNTPLVINGDCILALTITRKLMKLISRRNFQIIEAGCKIHILQLSNGSRKHVPRHLLGPARFVELFRMLIGKRLYHGYNVTRHVTLFKG